jgi:hypoxanthine phosphoribosyltransferase
MTAMPQLSPPAIRDSTAGELVVSWEQYHRLIEHLALQLHQGAADFDQIVALSRGGLRVGDLLSRLFDRPLVVMAASSYSGDGDRIQGQLKLGHQLAHTCDQLGPRLLLVDDLVDSGTTLVEACAWLNNELRPAQLLTGVLWLKGGSNFQPDFWAMELPENPWIVQPFERWELIQPEELEPMS